MGDINAVFCGKDVRICRNELRARTETIFATSLQSRAPVRYPPLQSIWVSIMQRSVGSTIWKKASQPNFLNAPHYPIRDRDRIYDSADRTRGHLVTNLFAGLTTCAYCAGPVRFHSNGNAKRLICSEVIHRLGCYRMAWSYRDFENSFFDFAKHTSQSRH
jgi:hypothetical protein